MTLEEALPCDCDGLNRPEHLTGCPAIHRPAIEQLRAADQARIAELEAQLKSLANWCESISVFVNSRQKIKQPEGRELHDEKIAMARSALPCKTCGGRGEVLKRGSFSAHHDEENPSKPCPTCGGSDE